MEERIGSFPVEKQNMPNYKCSNMGEFVHSEVCLPTTLEHICQFLGFIQDDVWAQIQAKAEELKSEKTKLVKKSSFTKIIKSSPREIAAEIIREYLLYLENSEKSKATISTTLSVLRQLFKDLRRLEVIDEIIYLDLLEI